MSEYRKVKTQFTKRSLLRQALKAAGVPFVETMPGQPEKHLVGYQGDARREVATFIVRRQHVSSASNDLGFHWDRRAQCFTEIVSAYDSRNEQAQELRKRIKREYAVAHVVSQARSKGWQVARQNDASGEVQLVVTGRV